VNNFHVGMISVAAYHGNEPGDQFLLVARMFTPNGFNLLAISTPMAPNPRRRT